MLKGARALVEMVLKTGPPKTAIDFLLAHNVPLRSESRLAAEFPDFTISLPSESLTPCFPMIMIMENGKMNPLWRLEYRAVVRHRNPLLCTTAHTAFYLFYWWKILFLDGTIIRRSQKTSSSLYSMSKSPRRYRSGRHCRPCRTTQRPPPKPRSRRQRVGRTDKGTAR
jgi:hypothetical protein